MQIAERNYMTLTAEKSNQCIRQRLRPYLSPLIFMAADYTAVILTGQLSNSIYDLSIDSSYIYLWLPVTFLIFLAQAKA